MPLPLLQTKLYLPPPRPQLIVRAPLLARLSEASICPLTLVSAPAGFGKTTLVSQWLAQRNGAVAWFSLDEDDSDPSRFLHYLVAALQAHSPRVGETALALLAAPQPPPPKTILTLLLNDLNTLTTPLLLVLDDYHLIQSQPIHEALAFLIDHLPPTLQLVITSRIDPPLPLSRWRVRNQLTEIRAADLRFTADETAIFLNEVMGLKLTSSAIATLEARTEGWIAGLQLAALSMHGRNDREAFIASFGGSNHYIVDYLIEEVLTRLPKATESFLLTTSILDRFCAPLCEALTGQGEAQQTLHFLEKSNLFLISLDNQREWYRYHHLFAEVLHNRLQQAQPQLIGDLHCRASDWYQCHALFVPAIHHALAAHSLERVSTIIEEQGLHLLLRGEAALVNGWLRHVPEALLQARPRLALTACWNWMTARQINQVAQFLATTELDVERLPAELQGERVLLDAHLAFFHEEFAKHWLARVLGWHWWPMTTQLCKVRASLFWPWPYCGQGRLRQRRLIYSGPCTWRKWQKMVFILLLLRMYCINCNARLALIFRRRPRSKRHWARLPKRASGRSQPSACSIWGLGNCSAYRGMKARVRNSCGGASS